jgi:aminoglycoside phosphotransferase
MAAYRSPQIRGDGCDQMGMIDFAHLGVASRYQYRTRPRRECRVDVAAYITDHQAVMRSDP